MDATQLIMLMGGGIGSLIIGWLSKKVKNEILPNGLIPLINGTVFTVGFATLGGLGFTYAALLAGMSAAYVGTAAYEITQVKKKEADQ